MAIDQELLKRVQEIVSEQPDIMEKRMFGGIGFFVNGNYACGVSGKGNLVVRVGPDRYVEALNHPHAREMDITGRPMRGWVFVDDEGYEEKRDLSQWVQLGLDFASSLPPKEKKQQGGKVSE